MVIVFPFGGIWWMFSMVFNFLFSVKNADLWFHVSLQLHLILPLKQTKKPNTPPPSLKSLIFFFSPPLFLSCTWLVTLDQLKISLVFIWSPLSCRQDGRTLLSLKCWHCCSSCASNPTLQLNKTGKLGVTVFQVLKSKGVLDRTLERILLVISDAVETAFPKSCRKVD